MLSRLRIKHRLWLLIGVALTLIAVQTVLSLLAQREETISERRQKTRALTESALTLIRHYGELAAAGKLELAPAQDAAKAAVGALRYDGDNYFFIVDREHRMLRHPMKPELEGKDLSGLKDANGVAIVVGTVAAARRGKGEFVDYVWPRGGDKVPVPKVSTSALYEPWGWVVSTGIYVDDVDAAFRRALGRTAAFLVLIVALLLVVSVFVTRSITRPLETLQQAMRRLADTGDLAASAEVAGGGEPAVIARAFNAMVASFRRIVEDVSQTAGELLAASGHLAGNARRIEHSSSEQSDAATATAAAVEEISANVQYMTGNVGAVLELSQAAHRHADDGAAVVRQASAEMVSIAGAVEAAASSVKRLGDDSRKISDIVSVIREVAEQTNLLALNAAIEAARAGEAGRGFAVVADEVRKLAERTAKSTGEISAMIGGIQGETTQAVERMREVSERAQRGVQLAAEAGESVALIDASSGEVSKLIGEIAGGSREQSTASEQIAGNMARVSEMTQTNAGETADMAASAQQLEKLAKDLSAGVARFKV